MSLFTAKEWWATQLGASGQEEFDQGSLCVANIDNDPSGAGELREERVTGQGDRESPVDHVCCAA